MDRQRKLVLLGYVTAIVVCAAIALFDRVLIGLIGAGLCTVAFAIRFFASAPDKKDEASEMFDGGSTGTPPVGAVGTNEHVVYGAPPFSYLPGHVGYRPPEDDS